MSHAGSTRIRAIIGATAGAVALMAFGGTAVAGTPAVGSEVTLKEVGNTFRGKVTSEKRTCERKRAVYVYRKQDGEDKLIGIDSTDSNGKYLVDFNLVVVNVEHYAIAFPKETDEVECKQAKSDPLFPQG